MIYLRTISHFIFSTAWGSSTKLVLFEEQSSFQRRHSFSGYRTLWLLDLLSQHTTGISHFFKSYDVNFIVNVTSCLCVLFVIYVCLMFDVFTMGCLHGIIFLYKNVFFSSSGQPVDMLSREREREMMFTCSMLHSTGHWQCC